MEVRSFGTILVTGGCGFIGSAFIRALLGDPSFRGRVVNLDVLSYAGKVENLAGIPAAFPGRYAFIQADIRDAAAVEAVFQREAPDAVAHFAAESHVDRSLGGPRAFVETNVLGTCVLLEAARRAWAGREDVLFHHIGTDEVFGSLGAEGRFSAESPYDPRSPYSASKAASDHLVRAWHHSYGLPVTLSTCTNNYGPRQHGEKLIPRMIGAMLRGESLPVYGDGRQVRDWLYVEDHVAAIRLVMERGEKGATYLVGGGNERMNLDLVRELCEIVARALGVEGELLAGLIRHVADRPGHDRRYALDTSRIRGELGWEPRVGFREGLERTVRWYLDHPPGAAAGDPVPEPP